MLRGPRFGENRCPGALTNQIRAPMWMATASCAGTLAANQPLPSTVITGPLHVPPAYVPWMTSQYRPAGNPV